MARIRGWMPCEIFLTRNSWNKEPAAPDAMPSQLSKVR